MNKEYQFYEMMWYPTPFNKEFFAYFGEPKSLIGGEPLALSRGKSSVGLVLAQDAFHKRWWIWRYIPYVELVALTWEVSFNSDNIEYIWLRIVVSSNRLWSVHVLVKVVLWLMNLRQKRKWWLEFKLVTMHEQDDLNVYGFKDAEYDIIPVYQLSHLSLWYQKFWSTYRNIFESNNWLQEYLPHHPLQFVIGCGQKLVSWKSKFGTFFEKFFSNVIGDFIHFLFKKVSIVWLLVLKKFWRTNARMQDGIIWHDIWNKQQYMLRWKVMRKEGEH